MNLRLTENEKLSEVFLNWTESAAKTENAFLSDFFSNWNENAAKAENEILLEKFHKIGMTLRLRQKMIMSLNKFVEFG